MNFWFPITDFSISFFKLFSGTSGKINRFIEIFYNEAIVEPDLRHFLYIQNRSMNIYESEVYEFMGFNYLREESPE